MAQQHSDGTDVLTAVGNDQIRMLPARFDKLKKHGPDRAVILLQDRVEATVAFQHVPSQPPRKTDVHRHVDVDLEVEQVPQLRHVENQDALKNQHPGGLEPICLRMPVVLPVVILRDIDRSPLPQQIEMFNQQFVLDGLGMVVVDLFAVCERQIIPPPVVAVFIEDRDIRRSVPLSQPLVKLLGKQALSRPRSPRDPDDGLNM